MLLLIVCIAMAVIAEAWDDKPRNGEPLLVDEETYEELKLLLRSTGAVGECSP